MKDDLIPRLEFKLSVSLKLINDCRRSVAGKSPNARIALRIGADRVVELPRTTKQNPEIRGDHFIRRIVQSDVRLQGAGAERQHHVRTTARMRNRDRRARADKEISTVAQAQHGCVGRGGDRSAGREPVNRYDVAKVYGGNRS